MGTLKLKGLEQNPEAIDDLEDGFADLEETRRFAGYPARATLWRWCKQGWFPEPEWIGPNRRAWRRRLLREWAKDPKGWAEQHRQLSADAQQEADHDDKD